MGAIAAYGAANFAPERWGRLVTGAIPPLGAIGTKLFAYEHAAAFMSPGSKVEIVAGTGHFFHVEAPAAVNRLIVDWVTAQP